MNFVEVLAVKVEKNTSAVNTTISQSEDSQPIEWNTVLEGVTNRLEKIEQNLNSNTLICRRPTVKGSIVEFTAGGSTNLEWLKGKVCEAVCGDEITGIDVRDLQAQRKKPNGHFVNEFLTSTKFKIYKNLRQLKTLHPDKIKGVFIRNSNILYTPSDSNQIVHISSLADLNNIVTSEVREAVPEASLAESLANSLPNLKKKRKMDELLDVFSDYPEYNPDVNNYVRPNFRYMNVECLSDFINGSSLTILMLNIRSCNKNFDQFISTFCDYISYFTCIVLTETWLTKDCDALLNINGFYCIDQYRSNYGGSIKVFVRKCMQSKVLSNFCVLNDVIEMLTIELLYSNYQFLLTAVYHPPTSFPVKNMEFVDFFTLYLKQLVDMKVPLVVVGDFNVNLLNPRNCVYVDMYIENLFELGLRPLVILPTKVNIENIITRFSIIDHIWVSDELRGDQTLVIPISTTDHFLVVSVISAGFQLVSDVSSRRHLVGRVREAFRIFLSNIHVNMSGSDINTICDEYFTKVLESYNKAFPIENYTKKSKNSSPWMTPRLKECIKKKVKLFRVFKGPQQQKRLYFI